MICKNCQKEKMEYGVWVDGKCPDCISLEVLKGKKDIECVNALSHIQKCKKCQSKIIKNGEEL